MERFRQMRGNTKAALITERFDSIKPENMSKTSILDVVHEHSLYSWVSDCF